MNEHLNFENHDEEKDINVEDVIKKPEDSIEVKKKQEEISSKKNQTFHLSQSKDSAIADSAWGTFKIRPVESIDILENEPFYRTPLTNIIKSDDGYYLFVELPGLSKKNVEISLQEGILEILGEETLVHKDKKEEKKDKDRKDKDKDKKDKDKKDKKKEKHKEIKGDYLRREIRSASFFRSFYLPEDIDTEGIDATFRNGVLNLKIPKKITDITEKRLIDIK